MSEHEPPPSTKPSEIEDLIARLRHGSLNNHDTLLVERLLRLLLTLIRVVEQKNTSISRPEALAVWTRLRDAFDPPGHGEGRGYFCSSRDRRRILSGKEGNG